MSHIDQGLVDDATTDHMVGVVLARETALDVEAIAIALLDAGFRSHEITLRIDSVLAGARKIVRTVELVRAMS